MQHLNAVYWPSGLLLNPTMIRIKFRTRTRYRVPPRVGGRGPSEALVSTCTHVARFAISVTAVFLYCREYKAICTWEYGGENGMRLTPDQELVRQKLIDRVKTVKDLLVTYKRSRTGWTSPFRECGAVGNVILDFFNIADHDQGDPMLSAIVVSVQTSRPGDRFFDTARFLEVLGEGEDEESFWICEINRVCTRHRRGC